MSTTPATSPYNPTTSSNSSSCCPLRPNRSFSSSSSSVPLPRATALSPIPLLSRPPGPSTIHPRSESPFEPRPTYPALSSSHPQNLHPASFDFDLLTLGTLDTPTKPQVHRLTLDLDFNTSWTLDVPTSASSAMSYVTATTSGVSPPPSPGDDDVFRAQYLSVSETSPRPNTEFSFTFTSFPEPDHAGASSQSNSTHPDSTRSSPADSDLTLLLYPRLSMGFAQEDAISHGFAEQRYLRSAVPTPYYTAHSTPEPELVDDGLKAGPSRLPILNTNLTGLHIPAHLSETTPSQSRDPASGRPPSPTPTADFSMISVPSSPTFYQYTSQQADDAETDPFRFPNLRGSSTLPFLRSNSTPLAGPFHFAVNGRTQSMNASTGLGPALGKPRRGRPGISRLWESIASPAKGSPQPSSVLQDAHLSPIPATRTKSSPMSGFSVVRSKTSPMMGVGRKLKEKRRIKRVRRGPLEVDTDVDYGALDPLDGEEGELVGCTCTGWGDGGCVCGYGFWDDHNYGHELIQEPECIEEGAPKIPTPLTRLPPELFLQVLSYLPLRSVLAVAATCKAWRSLALDNGVWWGLWQAREGVPRIPNLTPGQSADLCHRIKDSFGGFGRRYRGIRDEGIHGLSIPTTEHEHDGEQWDESRGWAVNFDRANMKLKETARLGCEGAGKGVFVYPSEKRREDGQLSDVPPEGDKDEHEVEKQEAKLPAEPQPISRQAPLMLDWYSLYRGRSVLEQRWRDPEGEPRVLRIDGHKDSVYCLDFDSSRIISGSRDRTIKVWCIKTGKCLASFEGHTGSVLCLKFERDWDLGSDGVCRGFMVSGSSDCTVCVWDLVSTPVSPGENVAPAGGIRPGKSRVSYAAAAAGSLGPPRKISAELRKILRGHSGGVLDLRMDENWIVSCSKDALMHVYDRKTLTLHTVLRGHEGPVNAVGLENGRLVSASGDGKMMLWNVETGECIRVFEGHEKGLACIEFKDGLILSGSNDCTIKLWRASTGECLHTFAGHTLLVRALCFDPRTGYIVSTSYDKSVRVWEWHGEGVESDVSQPVGEQHCRKSKGVGRLVREFRNLHSSHIFDVKFDVGKIVSTSHDQKIVVLDFSYGIEGAELFA
ncbi:hypothetical protein JVU11DRAFT_6162 [Chiua virens]|nr:hypothetical protein JVU11DRAFT_6162 [Chiua virens]